MHIHSKLSRHISVWSNLLCKLFQHNRQFILHFLTHLRYVSCLRRIDNLFNSLCKSRFYFLHIFLHKLYLLIIIIHPFEILSHIFSQNLSPEKPLCGTCPHLLPHISTGCFAIQYLVEDYYIMNTRIKVNIRLCHHYTIYETQTQ